ncbi:MAG: PAS domain S-box protein [Pseudomonadota bacterium]
MPGRADQRARSAESAELYRRIAETIPHMVWTARPDGRLEYFNARWFAYTGRSARQLEGWGWRSVIHPEDWARCLETWTAALESGRPYEIEVRLKRRDGRFLWHLGAALPLRERGRIVAWFGTCTDIDQQKRAARLLEQARRALESVVAARTEALEESGRRLRAFLDAMPAIAWIKDSRLRYVWTSASYARVHGKPPSEVLGRDTFEVWPEALARRFQRDDEKALRAHGPVQSINSAPYASGAMARWLVVRFPLPDETGALGVAAIGFDVTSRIGTATGEEPPEKALDRLSGRERQVLRLVVDGLTSAEVGARLGLSPKSVDTYRSRLMAKLGIEDLPTLVKFAIRSGLTTTR